MRMEIEDTLCLVIDIQERLAPSINNMDQVEKNSVILLKGLKALGVETLVTRQYPKGLGDTIQSIKDVTENCVVLDKVEFSCFANQSIKEHIVNSGKKNIILIGIEAHICVLQTLIDLSNQGYNVIFVDDCVSSRKGNDKHIALKRAEKEGAFITTYEAILFELLKKAGSDIFKVISNLIK